jgi:predicted nucleic acid-binding Zn ribbon protein
MLMRKLHERKPIKKILQLFSSIARIRVAETSARRTRRDDDNRRVSAAAAAAANLTSLHAHLRLNQTRQHRTLPR